jgi:hypothetical protein
MFAREAVPSLRHFEKLVLVLLILHIASKRAALLGVLSVLGPFGHGFRFSLGRGMIIVDSVLFGTIAPDLENQPWSASHFNKSAFASA